MENLVIQNRLKALREAMAASGIDYYMIVDVALVDMCTDHKGVVALRQLHGKLTYRWQFLIWSQHTRIRQFSDSIFDLLVNRSWVFVV